jgi:DNA-binding LacI/PurR family transcriptional regulator
MKPVQRLKQSLRTSATESTWPPVTSTAITPVFITLAVPSLIPPYLAELANRTIEAARQRDYSVYVTTYAEGSAKGARDLLKNFNSTVSDGMILSMSEVEDISPEDLKVDFPAGYCRCPKPHGVLPTT